jgi:hypothetical protein
MRGVKKGYKANWGYRGTWKERKMGKRNWRFSFRATKKRKAKGYGSHPKGRRIRWKVDGYQDVIKTGKGKYQTHLYGKKKLVRVGHKRL